MASKPSTPPPTQPFPDTQYEADNEASQFPSQ